MYIFCKHAHPIFLVKLCVCKNVDLLSSKLSMVFKVEQHIHRVLIKCCEKSEYSKITLTTLKNFKNQNLNICIV